MFDQIHRILGKTRGKTQCETFIIWIRRKKEVKCISNCGLGKLEEMNLWCVFLFIHKL
jgi:hypothetical protein